MEESAFVSRLKKSADRLCLLQHASGYIPFVFDPYGSPIPKIDVPRLAFTAWSLSEFGNVLNYPKYSEAAHRAHGYIQRTLNKRSTINPETALTYCYWGQLSKSLGKSADADTARKLIINFYETSPSFEPILFSQCAMFLKHYAGSDPASAICVDKLTDALRAEFMRNEKKEPLALAHWAELVNVFRDTEKSFSNRIASWLVSHQLPDGSFPTFSKVTVLPNSKNSEVTQFSNAVGKIVEILSLEPDKNFSSIKKALEWLFSLQYQDNGIFKHVSGGFRMNAGDPRAWIDTTGHILLGCSRLLRLLSEHKAEKLLNETIQVATFERGEKSEEEQDISEWRPYEGDELATSPLEHEAAVSAFPFQQTAGEHPLHVLSEFIVEKLQYWLEYLTGRDLIYRRAIDNINTKPFWKTFAYLKDQGVISRLWALEHRYNDAPAFYRFGLEAAYGSQYTDGNVELLKPFGHGFAKDKALAIIRALGEFLERYFLTLYKQSKLIRSSYSELKQNKKAVIELDGFAEFSEEQKINFPSYRWNETSTFSWERVIRLSSKKDFLIPAQYVYWNYRREPEEPILVESNTNGCGGHVTREKAALSGLYELIHRDAFLIHWLRKSAPTKVNPETIPDSSFRTLYDESMRYGYKVHCLKTTLDIDVPSFVVILEDIYDKWPKFALGGGCESDPGKALRRALEEAWSVHHWMRKEREFALPERYEPFRDMSIGQNERLRLWSTPEMAEDFSFILAGPMMNFNELSFAFPKEFSTDKEELARLINEIERLGKGYEVYGYFPVHSILTELGYHSAKIIVPQLIPLYLTETRAPLGSKRLASVNKIGLSDSINPLPHPFP